MNHFGSIENISNGGTAPKNMLLPEDLQPLNSKTPPLYINRQLSKEQLTNDFPSNSTRQLMYLFSLASSNSATVGF